MSYALSLSQLLTLVQETLDAHFYGQAFWVKCEITDVKKYDQKNWCFCKLLEKKANQVVAETPGVFWQNGYQHIRRFEKATGQKFENGIEISCLVLVKFHPVYGMKLEVQEIDLSFSLGQMELARQETIRQLLLQYPNQIRQVDDVFITPNKQMPLPRIIQRIALITANHSDGQRDFIEELNKNIHGYAFKITGFLTTIQGTQAAAGIVKQFKVIQEKKHLFDVVALVRGGGSQTDLKPFDDFELAKTVALFPLPILTGIGHDRNTSVADLMARQYKVPTKVAASIVDHNHQTDRNLLLLREKMEDAVGAILFEKRQQIDKWQEKIQHLLPNRIALFKQKLEWMRLQTMHLPTRQMIQAKKEVEHLNIQLQTATTRYLKAKRAKWELSNRMVEQLAPEATLKRGFAILSQNKKIITNLGHIDTDKMLTAQLSDGTLNSKIIQIIKNDG